MSSATHYRADASAADVRGYDDGPRGAGWIAFATCMLLVAGTWNCIEGVLAIANSHVFGAVNTYVFSDLNTWGWILLCVGVLQVLAAFAIISGSELARWFGIGAAGINAIAQLGFIPSYPWWSVALFAVDVMIIYGLAAYGGKRLREG